jgi:hypothetical protein
MEAPPRPAPPEPTAPEDRKVRLVIWEVVSLFLGTAAAVLFVADFAFSRGTTWSLIPVSTTVFLWITASIIILASGRIQFIVAAETVALLALLAVVDGVTPGPTWFLFPVAPLMLLAGILVSVIIAVTRLAHLSALSVVALSMLAAGLLTVGVETGFSHFLTQKATVSWSMLSFACVLPPVLVLLYLQHRLRDSAPEIRKRFHL